MKGSTNSLVGTDIEYENLNITLITNQNDHSDLVGTNIKVIYENEENNYTYAGSVVNIKIPAYVQYTISFSKVDNYKTPDNITGTAIANNSQTLSVEYKTELVSVTSNVEGAPITINGVKYTYDGNPITVKIAYDTEYQVTPENFNNLYTTDNFSYTANKANRAIACTYTTSTLKVAITSNQSNDSLVSNTKITVKYGSTTTTVGNGEEINIPINTSITLTIPGKGTNGYSGNYNGTDFTENYTTTITNTGGQKLIIVAYTTILLTVNVTSDGEMPTGYNINISQSGGPNYVQTTTTATHKVVPNGILTVSANDVEGFITPESITTSYYNNTTIEMQYIENSVGIYIINTNHKCYTVDQWKNSSNHGTAMGVAIVTKETSFVMAPTFQRHWMFNYNWSYYNGGPITENTEWLEADTNAALLNYDGKTLTSKIYNSVKNLTGRYTTSAINNYYWSDNLPDTSTGIITGSPAINYVYSYKFPDGTTGSSNNYIGSWGQWTIVNDNKAKVNECLDLISDYNLDVTSITRSDVFNHEGYTYWASSSCYIFWTSKHILTRVYYNYESNISAEPHYTFYHSNQIQQFVEEWVDENSSQPENFAHFVPFCDLPSNTTYA